MRESEPGQQPGVSGVAVYDIVLEGVRLVNNYRTQFNTIILKDSYAGLVKQMHLKTCTGACCHGSEGVEALACLSLCSAWTMSD